MGLLDRILGKRETKDVPAEPKYEEVKPAECPHTALTPHWQNPDEMGQKEKATYRCDACGESFPYEQAKDFLDQPPAVLLNTARAPEVEDDGKQE
jgi:hypothetical protein